MSNKTEAGTQTIDSYSGTIDLGPRQTFKMDTRENDIPTSELTLRSVDERVKQATDPILRQEEELCGLLANQNDLESTGNREASGSTLDNTSARPLSNRHDNGDKVSLNENVFFETMLPKCFDEIRSRFCT